MSEKVQLVRELLNMAKEIIYAPPPAQESPEEKKVKAAVGAIKDLADVAVKLQAHETQLTAVLEKVDEEVGKLKAITVLSLILAGAAVLIALLLK